MSREHRLVVMGSGGVGKSALTVMFVQGIFLEAYDPTVEDSHRKQTEIDGVACVLEILDTAGSSQFTAMRDLYMRMGQGFLLVYGINDRETYQTCLDIHERIRRVKDTSVISCVLVGNKIDLEADRRVTRAEAETQAASWKCSLVECSVKNNVNVSAPFEAVVRLILAAAPPPRKKKPCVLV